MAEICYKKAESLTMPSETDSVSSPDGIFIRKNIETVEVTDLSGETVVKYRYDEAFLTADEYEAYKTAQYKDSVSEALNSVALRREAEIIDDYTLKLIEEGVI